MSAPSRSTPAGAAYLDLREKASEDRRPFQELIQLYVLERYLARLVASPRAERFALKGGVLLAAFGERRPTRDVDLHAQALDNDAGAVRQTVCEIARIDLADGAVFDADNATAGVIRDEELYPGVRVTMDANLATARVRFHVDVNVGDPTSPAPTRVQVPMLLGGELTVLGYPLALVHAEKIVTAVSRGTASTRWRDFADIYLLARRHPVDGHALVRSIAAVAGHRRVALEPLAVVLDGYAEIGQSGWAAWRRRQLMDDRLPERFGEALDTVIAFAEPALAGKLEGMSWDPAHGAWVH